MKNSTGNPSGSKLGIYQLHNGEILQKRLSGQTLQQIGDELGVSRERVRQVLKSYFHVKGIPFLRSKDVQRVTGLSPYMVWEKARELGVKKQGSCFVWDRDSIAKLLSDVIAKCSISRVCRVCERPITAKYRRVFCSEKCRRKSNYRFLSPEKKAHHLFLTKGWQREHPVEAKTIQDRATQKLMLKLRKNKRCRICREELPPQSRRKSYCYYCLPKGMVFRYYKGQRYRFVKRSQLSYSLP